MIMSVETEMLRTFYTIKYLFIIKITQKLEVKGNSPYIEKDTTGLI